MKSKDHDREVATLWALAKNTDINEGFKGPLAEALKGPMREAIKAAHQGKTKRIINTETGEVAETREVTDKDIDQLFQSWQERGEVDPAYVHTFLQHTLMKATDGNEDQAARLAKQVGFLALSNGQGHLYGAQTWDAQARKMRFEDMDIHMDPVTGKLHLEVNDVTSANSRGKNANIATRTMMRIMHPGMFGIEKADGTLGGLSKLNQDLLISQLNASILKTLDTRAHEFRPDLLSKPVESQEWQRSMEKLSHDLETNWQKFVKRGVVANREQALEKARMLDTLVKKLRAIYEGYDPSKV